MNNKALEWMFGYLNSNQWADAVENAEEDFGFTKQDIEELFNISNEAWSIADNLDDYIKGAKHEEDN